MPKISCIDINPDVEGCQAWRCDEANGWFWNQDASYRPNPSNEVCCLVSFEPAGVSQASTAQCLSAGNTNIHTWHSTELISGGLHRFVHLLAPQRHVPL
jgi:hypothetical protein